MKFSSHAALAGALLPAVIEAAQVILQIRDAGFTVDRKSDDSPVTEADHRAEDILSAALRAIHPDIPVVAEESSASGSAPRIGSTFFLLDPLDGTRDYAAGRDDFSINVGLVDSGQPVFGLIYAPARRDFFLTLAPGEAMTATVDPASPPRSIAELGGRRIGVRRAAPGSLSALLSRSEIGSDFDDRLAALGVTTRTGISSAVKFGLVARGDADIYPRFGPTCEWDTAAGQAIVEAAGGTMTALDGSPMIYGKAASGFLNGSFVARGRVAV
jgi:3'(2'), 5'-bisphosphate nucleotidase